MYCPSCGATLIQEMNYCNRCGANLNVIKGSGKSKSLEKSVESTIWSIVGITLSVLGIIGCCDGSDERIWVKRRSRCFVHGIDVSDIAWNQRFIRLAAITPKQSCQRSTKRISIRERQGKGTGREVGASA